MKRILLPLFLAAVVADSDSHAQSYRLKAFSHGHMPAGVYVMSDSNTYFYSNGRGSSNVEVLPNIDNNYLGNPEPVGAILYDSAIYQYSSLPTSPFEHHVQSFDGLGRPAAKEIKRYVHPSGLSNWARYSTSYYGASLNVQKFTIEYGTPASANWSLASIDTFAYDASNNLIHHLRKETYGTTLTNRSQTSNIYTGGLLSVVQTDYWSSSASNWVMDKKWEYYYNGSNGLNKTIYFRLNQKTTDSFDNTGLQVSSLLESRPNSSSMYSPKFRDTFIYTGTQLMEKTSFQYTNGSWVNFMKVEYIYNGTQLTDKTTYTFSGGNWVADEKFVYASSGSTERIYWMDWNAPLSAFDTLTEQVRTYNPGGLLTSFDQYYYSGGTPTHPDSMFRLYYESYNPLDVNNTAADTKTTLNLYPVPANHVLHFELAAEKAGNMTISLFDMQGRLVRQSTKYTDKTARHSIAVADLPTGQYILDIRLGNEVMQKRFSVLR